MMYMILTLTWHYVVKKYWSTDWLLFILQLTPLVNSRCTPPLTTVKSCSMCPLCCLILPTTPNRYLSISEMKHKTGFITIIQRIHRKQNVDNLYRVVCCSFVQPYHSYCFHICLQFNILYPCYYSYYASDTSGMIS